MRVMCLVVLAGIAASASADPTVTEDVANKKFIISVPTGESYQITTSQADALNGNNTYTNVLISGGGTVTTAKVFPSYSGDIHVNEGTLLEDFDNGLGSRAKCKVYVASGSKLDLKIPSGRTVYHAIDLADGAEIDFSIASVTIAGDFAMHGNLTFGGANAPGFSGGTMDMNGKTLTAPNGFNLLNPLAVVNPGVIEITRATTLYGPFNHDQLGTNLVLSLAAGSTYRYQTSTASQGVKGDYTNRCEWTIRCAGDLTLQANFGKCAYHGPIFVPADKKLTMSLGDIDVKRYDLYGPVSAGTISKEGYLGTLFLHNTNNIGNISAVVYGPIYAAYPESLPADLSKVAIANSETGAKFVALVMGCSNAQHVAGWSSSQIKAVMDTYASSSTRAFGVGALEGETAEVSLGVTSWDDYKFYFGAYGGGVVTLKDDIEMSAADARFLSYADSELVLTPVDSATERTVYLLGCPGRLRFDDAGQVSVRSKHSSGLLLPNGNFSYLSTLAFSGQTAATLEGGGHVRIPGGLGGRGMLVVAPVASVTNNNQLQLGCNANGQVGTMLVNGGEFTAKNNVVVGGYNANALGFIEVSDGLFRSESAPVAVGSTKNNVRASAIGQFFVKDGEVVCGGGSAGASPFSIGAGTTGVYWQVFGTVNIRNGLCVPRSVGSDNVEDGFGTATISGGSMTSGGRTLLADRIYSTGSINFNGGVFSTPHLYRTYGTVEQGARSTIVEDEQTTRAYVSFDGGTYRVIDGASGLSALRSELLGKGGNAPDRVTVFGGGAVFDTNGHDMNLSVPLEAPVGKGIASIGLPGGAESLSGYSAAPYVQIIGTGTNASAVVDYDSAKGEVKGIIVTNHGWGYDDETTARLLYGEDVLDVPVTLADNDTTGGLVKKGDGTLTLMAANSLGGAMTVEGGVLRLGVDGALGGSSIVCKGGSVDVAAGVSYPAGLEFDVSDLPFDSGAKYVIAKNWTGTVPEVDGLPKGWSAAVRSNGDLTVSELRGSIVIFR